MKAVLSMFVASIATCALAAGCRGTSGDLSAFSGIHAGMRPNIVLLYADDAGYADFGFQELTAEDMAGLTPNIDSIARAGVTCTNAYMSGCVCSPSRAGLLTGRYQQRFGHETNIAPGYMQGGMSLAESTVADRMRALDYRTGIIGKWHLGYPADYHPNRRGFDLFHGLLQGSRSYRPIENPSSYRVIQENGVPLDEKGYVTDRFGAAAVRFIEQQAAGDPPFFLFVSFTAPHGPLQAKKADFEALSHISKKGRRSYAGLVKALDDNVGIILDCLERTGLVENTLVVFTNDNGGQTQTHADNGRLRGRKGHLWEGGIRVPFCAQWPGRIPAGRALDSPVISLDLLPTFVSLAGGVVEPEWELDGMDVMPLLSFQVDDVPERAFFWRTGGRHGSLAVRRGRYKLVRELQDREDPAAFRLFDLDADLGEQHDLSGARPELAADLLGLAESWNATLMQPLWGSVEKPSSGGSRP